MKKIILTIIFILLFCGISFADSNLYLQSEKIVNGSWVFGLPVWEVELVKTPLIINWESRLNYTMLRGGGALNHHSAQTAIHVGIDIPMMFKGNGAKKDLLSSFFMTGGLGLIQYYEGNSDNIPAGIESLNFLRIGIWNKW